MERTMNKWGTAGEAWKNLVTFPGEFQGIQERDFLYRAKDDEQLEDNSIISSSGDLSFFFFC